MPQGAEVAADWASLKAPESYKGAVTLNVPNGRIVYRFHARDVDHILEPAARGVPVRFRVLIDGQPPAAAHGVDVDEQGNGTVAEQRMYQLIRQRKPIVIGSSRSSF